jgi:drug/metabolite transporter (DMT)-like permease
VAAGEEGSGREAWRTFGAYAAVYLIWGSTYLAIKLVSQHGAFVMAGSRFLVAGALLLAFNWAGCALLNRAGLRIALREEKVR